MGSGAAFRMSAGSRSPSPFLCSRRFISVNLFTQVGHKVLSLNRSWPYFHSGSCSRMTFVAQFSRVGLVAAQLVHKIKVHMLCLIVWENPTASFFKPIISDGL